MSEHPTIFQYNVAEAEAAQEKYCETHGAPMFAPQGGYCPSCGWNIYMPDRIRGGVCYGGYSVPEAGATLITGCPHCHATFCD